MEILSKLVTRQVCFSGTQITLVYALWTADV